MAAIFADDIFKCIFMDEMLCISIQISLKFVPKGPIDNKNRRQAIAWTNVHSSQTHMYGTCGDEILWQYNTFVETHF